MAAKPFKSQDPGIRTQGGQDVELVAGHAGQQSGQGHVVMELKEALAAEAFCGR
jgi:hypothetical protein